MERLWMDYPNRKFDTECALLLWFTYLNKKHKEVYDWNQIDRRNFNMF